MPFLYRVLEHKKDKHEYAEITGFEGNVTDLAVPDSIDGYRVEAIGNHAFAGRQDIVSVTLPESIETLFGFAFFNCKQLKKISLFDSIQDYYDGVCRQCDSLTDVSIRVNSSWYEVVRNFLADNDRTLRFTLDIHEDGKDPVKAVLTFPEYVYDFNENTMARTIQFSIAGSGMFYRECVDRRSINYREYDKLFEKAVIDGNAISEDIAIGRLLYPVELSDAHRVMYENYVRESSGSILKRLSEATRSDPENALTIKALLSLSILSEDGIDEAIKHASALGLSEVCAILMEGSRPHTTTSSEFVF